MPQPVQRTCQDASAAVEVLGKAQALEQQPLEPSSPALDSIRAYFKAYEEQDPTLFRVPRKRDLI